MPLQDPAVFLTIIVVILLSLSLHEFAHAKLADLAGDPTPRVYGRVTLNPIAHLDPAGTIMILLSTMSGFGIGWGKPVPVNPSRMKNPRWDHFVSVIGGPMSNLFLAAASALILRFILMSGGGIESVPSSFILFLDLMVKVNLALCFFNLIPLGPLDGHWLVGTFLPEQARLKWYIWNRQVGGFVLLIIVFGGQLIPEINLLGKILRPVVTTLYRYFTGVPL